MLMYVICSTSVKPVSMHEINYRDAQHIAGNGHLVSAKHQYNIILLAD